MNDAELVDIPIKPDVFWDGDFRSQDARLAGVRCGRCEETFFPPRRACPRCHSAQEIVPKALPTVGRVFALTHVARPATPYTASYVLALVDLTDGVRMLAQLKAAPDAVRVGDEVRLVVEPLFNTADGQRVWGYRFEPRPSAAH